MLECIFLTNINNLESKGRKELHVICRHIVQEAGPVDAETTIKVARFFPELLPNIIQAGANPHIEDDGGSTPFWHAICQATDLQDAIGTRGALGVYKKLIDLGACYIKQSKGNDLLDILVAVDMEPYLYQVMDYGLSKHTHMASDLLYRACNINNQEVSMPAAQIALSHGADPLQSHPQFKDPSKTFMDAVNENGSKNLIALLHKYASEKHAETLDANTRPVIAVRSRRI